MMARGTKDHLLAVANTENKRLRSQLRARGDELWQTVKASEPVCTSRRLPSTDSLYPHQCACSWLVCRTPGARLRVSSDAHL